MKNKLIKCIFPLLFLAGLSLLLYPLISNKWNDYRQSKLISTYDEALAAQSTEGKIDYAGEKAAALAYNEALQPYVLPDSFAAAADRDAPDETYLSCLNLTGDGMMGYVEVPKIGVKIPVYHTTEETVLQKAAGHLEGSSLPIGGEGSHAVISAHRGLPSASLFTDLDQLQEGDVFLLYILDETICYRVDRITVVEPSDTTALAAEEGKDLATLMTCTPYGVNSHRLLVRGCRVEYEEIEDDMVAAAAFSNPSLHTNYLLWVEVGLGVTGTFIFAMYFLDRKKRKIPGKAQAAAPKETENSSSIASTTAMAAPRETEHSPSIASTTDPAAPRETENSPSIATTTDPAAPEKAEPSHYSAGSPDPERAEKTTEIAETMSPDRKGALREWQDDWPQEDPEGWNEDRPEEEP